MGGQRDGHLGGLHVQKYREVNPPGRENRTSHWQQAGLA